MRRRNFIILVGGAVAAWPLAAGAQRAAKVHRIGILRVGPPPPSFIEPFRKGLRELGYVEGQNIIIEYGLAKSAALRRLRLRVGRCARARCWVRSLGRTCLLGCATGILILRTSLRR